MIHAARRVRVENVTDGTITQPSHAVIRITRASIRGSDLWPYSSMEASDTGQRMGHEAIGVVTEIGADVRTIKADEVPWHQMTRVG